MASSVSPARLRLRGLSRSAADSRVDEQWNAATRLTRHLHASGLLLLRERRVPGRREESIDHLAVGPGGVTVIKLQTQSGRVRVERIGDVRALRRDLLLVDGHDRTALVDGIERQIEHVRAALLRSGIEAIDIRGALCFPEPGGLTLVRRLNVRGVLIDGPKPVARMAARPGAARHDEIEGAHRALRSSFPPA